MEKVVLFGISDFAGLAYQLLTHDTSYEVTAFTVDRAYLHQTAFCGLPVSPFEEIEKIYPPQDYRLFILSSFKRMNDLRAEKYFQAKEKGYRFANYISSKAAIWPDLIIGENCCVMTGTIIDPFVQIGNNVILWDGNIIGHHTLIQDHCFITSHVVIGGNSIIGSNSFLGANSTIREETLVAHKTLVGAGAVILHDTKEGEVYKVREPELLGIRSDQLRSIGHKEPG
jgi:sugar O-acyltransferase (sialic acid O-acetyltransferase NeuD family)